MKKWLNKSHEIIFTFFIKKRIFLLLNVNGDILFILLLHNTSNLTWVLKGNNKVCLRDLIEFVGKNTQK